MTKTILYIHQSAELYGSDKALYYLAQGINKHLDFNVIVVLPHEGPLKKLLTSNNIRVIVSPVIKVSRELFSIKQLMLLPFKIISSIKALHKALDGTKIDIVHSNTLAVLLGAFYANRYKIKHIWHIHEIIRKPKIVSILFPTLVSVFSDVVVFNSMASRDFLCNKRKTLYKKSIVNLNGMTRDSELTPIENIKDIRKELFNASEKDLVIALVGRISKWKGQHLLLEAFHNLKKEFKTLKLMFIGSTPPNQEYLQKNLNDKIIDFSLENDCKIIPFQNDVWSVWDSIDLAIIPSTEPEPFGLVAIEAMLARKPVIAAKHGGLVEIIVDNVTGYFFEPNNVVDLENKIKKLTTNSIKMSNFGIAGFERADNTFSLQTHIYKFIKIYKSM